MKELQHLNKYFFKYKTNLVLGIIITIAARIFLLYTPRYIKEIFIVIEKYIKGGVSEATIKSELTEAILYIIGAAIIGGILTYFLLPYLKHSPIMRRCLRRLVTITQSDTFILLPFL